MIGFLLCLIFLSGIFEYPELIAIDARYRLKGEAVPFQDIVVIGITQRCLNQFGKFPWPRDYHAKLIDFLKDAGAKVIAMDIFFAQPSHDPSEDEALAASIKRAGNVILPVFMPYRISVKDDHDNFIQVDNLVESIPVFTEAQAAPAHINMIADADGVYRKAPVILRYSERIFFNLGIESAIKFLNVPAGEIAFERDALFIAGKRIPLEKSKFMYINFSAIEAKAQRFAFSDVAKGLVAPKNFKNKIVFVGQASQGMPNADILQTPFKEKYGLTMQASVASTTLENFYIKKTGKLKTCLWIFLLAIFICVIMVGIKTWSSTAISILTFFGLCFVAAREFILNGVLIDFVALAFTIAAAFIFSILFRIRFADRMVKTKELELDSILQAGKLASEGLKTDKASDVILATLINSVGARGLLLRWKNDKTSEFEKTYAYGSAMAILKSDSAGAEERLAQNTIKTQKAALSEEKAHSFLCAPLMLKGEVVGAVTLVDKVVSGKPNEIFFDEADLKLFMILTQQTAISLESARLYEEVNELFLSSIRALAETIDAKDPYTRGHVQRVTDVALAIADEMKLDEKQKKQLTVGSILHDIGKIGIKDAVLSKPSQLTEEEKKIFDQHPDIGSKIMKPIGQLEEMIPLIRHHHESYDGSGYPDGLKGEAIPLGARIMAVADTFDAMTSDRPYRKALPREAAKIEINKMSGKQFDPKVVEAFDNLWEKGFFRI